jgi:hypothetical protein
MGTLVQKQLNKMESVIRGERYSEMIPTGITLWVDWEMFLGDQNQLLRLSAYSEPLLSSA